MSRPVPEFWTGSASEVAPALLGWVLVVDHGDHVRSGRIVEVEAYEGRRDPASHAFGAVSDRNRVMFGPAGHLYVYRSYGIHWCANLVCGPEGEAGAVLVRAIEPLDGMERMWADRPKARRETDLGSGPGKLCAALGITGDHYGLDLFGGAQVRVQAPAEPLVDDRVAVGVRVGISKAVDRPWRFAEAANPHVSNPKPW